MQVFGYGADDAHVGLVGNQPIYFIDGHFIPAQYFTCGAGHAFNGIFKHAFTLPGTQNVPDWLLFLR